MDATAIIADVKRRFVAMAEDPPYVYRETPRELIEQHHQRLTTFVGYAEDEIAKVEDGLRIRLPLVFRRYLLEMCKSPGDLFQGSDLAGIGDFEQFRADALALMAETNAALSLPPEAVVFLFHQGYTFVYLLALGGFDGPVLQYTETEREPRELAPAFAELLDSELHLMESSHRDFHKRGGY